MFDRLLQRWWRPGPDDAATGGSRHVVAEVQPSAIYAIGDVHGCLELLRRMEAEIVADGAAIEGERWIVLLGDMVDRGDSSAQVLDHLLIPPPAGFRRFCLRGNHEAMMLDFLAHPRPNAAWLEFGGRETLLSYGIPADRLMHHRLNARLARQLVESYVPREHIEFLTTLPLVIETPEAIFVHAGLRPGVALGEQSEADLTGYRDDFGASFAEFGKTVVHGHVIRDEPLVTPSRIALDTGAYASGRLSAIRLGPGPDRHLFSVSQPHPAGDASLRIGI